MGAVGVVLFIFFWCVVWTLWERWTGEEDE